MKQLGIILTLFFVTAQLFGQSKIEDYVMKGIKYHDSGNYDKAIETYKKALKIDAKSPLVNYEIAFSYLKKGDYKKVIKYSNVVLDQKGDYLLQAYTAKGSALDLLGKTKESIKLLEEGIKKTGGHYLLHYNLALNYFKKGALDDAEKNVLNAIENNSSHSSSHLMLANIHNQKGNTVQTLLATHYFLFLEPNTGRSVAAYQMLENTFGGNVSKDKNEPNKINITLSPNNDSQFGAAELMVAMLEASKSLEENEGKTEEEMFVENTESFFTVLGELKEEEKQDIWWSFYVPLFYDLAESDHLETYCNYITQADNENAKKWLSDNEEKLMAFDKWLKER